MRQLDIETFTAVNVTTAEHLDNSKCGCTPHERNDSCARHRDVRKLFPSCMPDDPMEREFRMTQKQLHVETVHNFQMREELQKLVLAKPTDAENLLNITTLTQKIKENTIKLNQLAHDIGHIMRQMEERDERQRRAVALNLLH